MSTKLHVGNLAAQTTSAALADAFRAAGLPNAAVKLVMSRDPKLSRGFAFVVVESEAEGLAAVAALHGTELDGRQLRVSVAHPPKSRFGGHLATRRA